MVRHIGDRSTVSFAISCGSLTVPGRLFSAWPNPARAPAATHWKGSKACRVKSLNFSPGVRCGARWRFVTPKAGITARMRSWPSNDASEGAVFGGASVWGVAALVSGCVDSDCGFADCCAQAGPASIMAAMVAGRSNQPVGCVFRIPTRGGPSLRAEHTMPTAWPH